MNSKLAGLFGLMVAVGLSGAPASAIQPFAAVEPAARYEFSFEPDTVTLAKQTDNMKRISDAIDLLVRQGSRPEFSFVIVAEVPSSCLSTTDCRATQLLRMRMDELDRAFRQKWPSGMKSDFILRRLSWRQVPLPQKGARRETLSLVVLKNTVATRTVCPARLEVLDPKLPGVMGSSDVAAWIEASGEQPIPVSASARLRLVSELRAAASAIEVRLEESSGKSTPLHTQHDPDLNEEVYRLIASSPSFQVVLTDSMANASNDIAGVARPWAGVPASTRTDPGESRCSFSFVRWDGR